MNSISQVERTAIAVQEVKEKYFLSVEEIVVLAAAAAAEIRQEARGKTTGKSLEQLCKYSERMENSYASAYWAHDARAARKYAALISAADARAASIALDLKKYNVATDHALRAIVFAQWAKKPGYTLDILN